MGPNDEIQFEKPKSASEGSTEPRIHVMPEKFRGVTLEAKIPEVSVPQKAGRVSPPPKAPAGPAKAPAAPGAKKKFPWLIVAIVLVIILALAASVFFVLWGMRGPSEPVEEADEMVVEEPTPPPSPVVEEEEEEEITEEEEMATEEESLPATAEETLPATVEETIPPVIPEEPEVVLTGGVDADSDGLTDVEERLYSTDPQKPDTDSDGYLDGNEVYHLYNPGGTAPVTLLESELVTLYSNPDYGYSIYYPASWRLDLSKGTLLVMFSAATGEFVQVLTEDNPQDMSLVEWYLAQAPGADEEDLKLFANKAGIEGLQSPDRLTAYFKKDSRIYVVSLNIGGKTTIEYRRTYEMMLNSFNFIE